MIVCSSCSRHVRLTETSCPFCSARLSTQTSLASRAAAIAGVALAAAASVSCGGSTPAAEPPPIESPTGGEVSDPPTPDDPAASEPEPDADEAQRPAPIYGMPEPADPADPPS